MTHSVRKSLCKDLKNRKILFSQYLLYTFFKFYVKCGAYSKQLIFSFILGNAAVKLDVRCVAYSKQFQALYRFSFLGSQYDRDQNIYKIVIILGNISFFLPIFKQHVRQFYALHLFLFMRLSYGRGQNIDKKCFAIFRNVSHNFRQHARQTLCKVCFRFQTILGVSPFFIYTMLVLPGLKIVQHFQILSNTSVKLYVRCVAYPRQFQASHLFLLT